MTPINKAIAIARHIARYGDVKQKEKLRTLFNKSQLTQAARKLFDAYTRSGATGKLEGNARGVLLSVAN